MTINDFERRTAHVARLLNDMIIGMVGILIVLLSISGILMWSLNQPVSILPEWLFPPPAAFSRI